jgi:hypothetical protein
MKRLFILLTIGALGALGCDKKSDTPAGGEGAKTTDEKAVTLTDDDLPVKGDFVDEAEGSITKENYKGELDKLAGEIEKE